MKTIYCNLEEGGFFNAFGERMSRFVPELCYQEEAVWKIFLRDRENKAVDISGISYWSAAVDCDFNAESTPMCRTLPENITADSTAGAVTLTINGATSQFLSAVNGSMDKKAFFELCGFNSNGGKVISLVFEIRALMALDPDPELSPETPDTLATKAYVSTLIANGGVEREVITDSSTTSAYIPVLSGGVQYRYTQDLTSLDIAGVENSPLESEIIFTLADGGTVTLPPTLGVIGEPAFDGGKSYIINVRDNLMVAGSFTEGEV